MRAGLLRVGAAILAALGGAALGPVGAAAAASPADRAVPPHHVGIVVGGVGTACVPWDDGLTGAEVLDDEYTVVIGRQAPYAGFVLSINGIPASGTHPDNTHYWAYWHDFGGGWNYSSDGASGYRPKAGTLEGWSYQTGFSSVVAPPAASYDSLCGDLDRALNTPAPSTSPRAPSTTAHPPATTTRPATPRPTSSAPSSSVARTSSVPNSAQASQQSPVAVVAGTAASAAGQVQRPVGTASPSSGPAGNASRSSTVVPTGSANSTSMPSTTPPRGASSAATASLTLGPAPSKTAAKQVSSAPAIGTVAALVVVAGLGGFAYWRMRGRRRT